MSIARNVILSILIALFWSSQLAGQTGTINGRVTDATTAVGVPYATVLIEGTQLGSTTGPDGAFLIAGVPVGTHRVSARVIGYAPVTHDVTVTAGQATTVEFSLARAAAVMEEIVVTGYGAQRRAAITGSISTVNAEEANVGVTSNANDLMQGRVAGMQITQNHGEPGAGVQLRIRGGTSISGSNEPLYVIDGIVVQTLPTEPTGIGIGGDPALPRNPLNLINPSDIESISVLKDAAAAAIYGARAANGVILIQTKQGQRDRLTFEYDGYVSMANAARTLDVLDGAQYRQFIEQQVADGNLPASRLDGLGSSNTNWENEVTRSAVTHNHNLAFSGGTASTQYRASLNYMNQEGVTLSSGLERIQGRLNGTHYAWNDRLQLRLNLTASHVENDYVPFEDTGGFEGGIFQNMTVFNPTQPVMVTDTATGQGVFYEIGPGRQSVRNPVAIAEQIGDFAGTTRVLGNVRAQLDIAAGLSGQMIVGVDRSESLRRTYFPRASAVGAEWNGRAQQQDRDLTAVTLQGLLTYGGNFGIEQEHDLEVVGGYEYNDYSESGFGSEARNFLTDAFSFDNLSAGAEIQTPYSFRNEWRLIGFFGRATYGFRDRYFLTGVLRRDGSTRFGVDNKWGTFPAVSASWRIGEESFMASSPFSELRVRAGYGVQGNDAAVPYASLVLLQPSDGASYPFGDVKTVGVAPATNPNPNLKWEETSQFNIGVDFGFSDNQIAGSVEYYVKNTTDLLLDVTVPQPAATGTRLENIGEIRYSGLEASLDALLVTKPNLSWDAGLVFAAESNEVLNLGGRTFITSGDVSGQGQTGQVSQRILPGQPLGTFFGPEFVGVDDQGRQLFNDYDADGNLVGQTSSVGGDDFVVLGDANPDFVMGIRSGVRWGAFDASVLFRWEQGGLVFNNTALVYSTKGNALQDKNFLASALTDPTGINEPAIYSSRWLEDRTFFRLQNITIGYNFLLPGLLSGAGNMARAYISADNLFLLTGYSGYDPEAHSNAGLASRGIDYLSYPRARLFTAGVRLSF